MHVAHVAGVVGCERRHVLRHLLHHLRIGLLRHVTSAKMFGDRDHPERDRHPPLDRRRCAGSIGIALDPHQFGGTAADVEQDGAAPPGIEQRRTADHRERRLGLAVDHLQLDTGLFGDLVAENVGIIGGALPYLEATSGLNAGELSIIVAAVLSLRNIFYRGPVSGGKG